MQGSLFTYCHHDGKVVTVVEVSCQTDFAVLTNEFQTFGEDIAMHLAMSEAMVVPDLLDESLFLGDEQTVRERLFKLEQALGEDVAIVTWWLHRLGDTH